MKVRFFNRIHWRGLLPGVWFSWENTTMTVTIFLDGPAGDDVSLLSVEIDLPVPERIEPWLLPRWEEWSETRSWIN